ncbi:MAG: glycosyltransferase family 4 protein [Deltaproteobacteria bacterium]|nr:glycosyltransferase family 4 protein [Deltaproteobacteria bacterium]
MRLAFIKKRFSLHGGAERYLQTLIGRLKRSGFEIHIFADRWAEEEGLIFHRAAALPLGSFLSALSFNSSAGRLAGKKIADCVISFERTTRQDIYRAGEGCHAEWLEIRSKVEPFYKRASFRINPLHMTLLSLERKLFSKTKSIVANSEMVKGQIIRHYAVPEERITVIRNGVDLERFTPANRDRWRSGVRTSLGVTDNTRLILLVGSGFERKGLKTLLEAASFLKKEDINVLVIGKGDARRYSALAESLGLSGRVVFTGPTGDIERYYAAADLFVLPTLYDPFSNATLEALSSGLPVITTRNNGAAELITNGAEGFVVEDMLDARELAGRIGESLDRLAPMGQRARSKAEAFSIETACEKFVDVIERAAQPGGQSGV